ncbi:unnamed protein product, partial [Urochloa humidicola]
GPRTASGRGPASARVCSTPLLSAAASGVKDGSSRAVRSSDCQSTVWPPWCWGSVPPPPRPAGGRQHAPRDSGGEKPSPVGGGHGSGSAGRPGLRVTAAANGRVARGQRPCPNPRCRDAVVATGSTRGAEPGRVHVRRGSTLGHVLIFHRPYVSAASPSTVRCRCTTHLIRYPPRRLSSFTASFSPSPHPFPHYGLCFPASENCG